MNRIYRLVFSKKRGQLVAVAENSNGKGKGDSIGSAPAIGFASFRLCLDPGRLVCLGMTMLFSATPAWTGTLPAGGAVSVGSGTIATSGNTMTVQQDSQKLGINWQSFSIGAGDKVIFNQPTASSVALNRVNGGSRSEIYGNLSANGQVFLVNPNGVLFGKTAEVNVGGLLASTGNISDDDFAAGTYGFSGSGGGEVVNQGNLKAVNGGFIVLAANEVRNEGTISATGGSAVLAAGETISLDLDNSGRVQVKVDGNTLKALIDNQGLIEADGGSVVLTARGKEMVQDSAINLMGVVRARSIGEQNGAIVIDGGNVVAENATFDASGLNAAGRGGQVTVTGNSISLTGSTAIDVRGSAGGGTVLVGGDYQGQGELPHARTLNIGANTKIDASATGSGKGGKVVLWSDERTDFRGTINAMGGAAGGDGGLVETSSHGNLQAFGRVRAEAPLGKAGTWLLDPESVTFVESSTPPAETTQGGTTTGSQVSTESVNSQAGAGTTVVVQTATGTTQVTADTPAVSSDGNGTGVTSGNETAADPTTATPVADGISATSGTGPDTAPAPAPAATPEPAPAPAPAVVTDALPSGGAVFTGNGSISTDGGTMTVQQNSEKLGLNWQSFNIGTGNSVVFNQPGATSIALNRVLGGSRSEIYGKLKANGQVFLYNPGGLLFGPTAEVSVGSLSTSDISDSDFAVGTYTAPTTVSEVVNQGSITAEDGGTIELTGDKVENEGTISATGGSVALTSVASVVESAGLSAAITDATARSGLIENTGLIEADGGRITITAMSSDSRQENVINIDGVLRARAIGEESGSIVIDGGGGEVAFNNAKVDVTGLGDGEHGGEVTVTGKDISILGDSAIDARGNAEGGTVLVGGDYQGQGILPHAETVVMGGDAGIDVSATQAGDGGKVVLWSDTRTEFAGDIAAKGGTRSGNGGVVETSGKMLQVGETALVSTRAENGETGNWLLDPNNYTIAAAGGNISGATLSASLGSSNVTIQTASMGTAGGSGDIFVNDPISWSSIYRLTLDAERNVAINSAINASNSNSSLTVKAPDTLMISGTGSVRTGNANYEVGNAALTGSTTTTGTRLFIGAHGSRPLRIESSATSGALSLSPGEVSTLHAANGGDLNLDGEEIVVAAGLSASQVDAGHLSLHSRNSIVVDAPIDLSPSTTKLHFIADDDINLQSSIKAEGISLENGTGGSTSQASSALLTADWLQIQGSGAVINHASVGTVKGTVTGTLWLLNGARSISVVDGITAGNVGIYTNGTLTLDAPITATGSYAVSLGGLTWPDPLCTGPCARSHIDLSADSGFVNNAGVSALRPPTGKYWSLQTDGPATTTLNGLTPNAVSYNTPVGPGDILLSSNRIFYRQPDPGGSAPVSSTPVSSTATPSKPSTSSQHSSTTSSSSPGASATFQNEPAPVLTLASTYVAPPAQIFLPSIKVNQTLQDNNKYETTFLSSYTEKTSYLQEGSIDNSAKFPVLDGSQNDGEKLEKYLITTFGKEGEKASWVNFITVLHNLFLVPPKKSSEFGKWFTVDQLTKGGNIKAKFIDVIKDITSKPTFAKQLKDIGKGATLGFVSSLITDELKKSFPNEASLKDSFVNLFIDSAASAVTNAISSGTKNPAAIWITWQIGMVADMTVLSGKQSIATVKAIKEYKSVSKQAYLDIFNSYLAAWDMQNKSDALAATLKSSSNVPQDASKLIMKKIDNLKTLSYESRVNASDVLEYFVDNKGGWTELKSQLGISSNKISQQEALQALYSAKQIKERIESTQGEKKTLAKKLEDIKFIQNIYSNHKGIQKSNKNLRAKTIIDTTRELVYSFGSDYWKSVYFSATQY